MLTRRDFLRLSALASLSLTTPLLLDSLAAAPAITPTPSATPLPGASKSMRGLYALMAPNDDQIPSEVLASALITGVTLQINWSTLQPSPTVVAWDVVEGALKRVAAVGKRLALKPLTGTGSPAWLYGKAFGVKKYTFIPGADRFHSVEFGKNINMPYPWDKAMIAQWLKFVAALGQRFDGEPAFARVGVAGPTFQHAETYLPRLDTVMVDWIKAGYSLTNIETAWEQAIDAYSGAFRQTAFTMDLNPIPDPLDKSGSTLNGLVPVAIAQYGVKRYPGRFFPAQSDFGDVYPYLPALPGPTRQPALYESYEKQAGTIYNFLVGVAKTQSFGLTVNENRVSKLDNHVSAVIDRAVALNAGYLEIPVGWAGDSTNDAAFKDWPGIASASTPAATSAATSVATMSATVAATSAR